MSTSKFFTALSYLVLSFGVLCSCKEGNNVKFEPPEEECKVQVVFFDFYDEHVILKIGGVTIADRTFGVVDSSTSINAIEEIVVVMGALIEMKTDDFFVNTNLPNECSIKTIYVNPSVKPFVELRSSPVIVLD